nr:hypothetical protein [Tanacetum cinerariifolium]
TGTKLGVPDVPKYLSESKNKSWGDSDDDHNDDDSDEVTKDDDEDDVDSDADDDKEANDSENTNSDEDENLNLNQKDDEEEEYVRTLDRFEFHDDDEEYEELYKDMNILPKEISDFATPVIHITINESLENVVLAKCSSQSQSIYGAATSLTEFELKKILLEMLEKSKSYRSAEQHRDLYDALVKSYQLNKDLFDSYGKAYSLKRGHEDKDKDEDPPSVQAEEPVFETTDIEMLQDQRGDLGNTEDQLNVEEASKHDCFKKPKRPLTPDHDWNAGKQIDFRPPQTWISKIAKARKLPLTFDELMSTPIEFLTYSLNNLNIENLTQEYLVGPAFNLLKGTCESRVELEYNFEECYKVVTYKLD